jgi:hypothetical protein
VLTWYILSTIHVYGRWHKLYVIIKKCDDVACRFLILELSCSRDIEGHASTRHSDALVLGHIHMSSDL